MFHLVINEPNMSDINEFQGVTNQPETDEQGLYEPQEYNEESAGFLGVMGDNAAEKILCIVAYAILAIGLILTVIYAVIVGSMYGQYTTLMGWMIFFGGTIYTVIAWASLMVYLNISTNIREIKHELRRRK